MIAIVDTMIGKFQAKEQSNDKTISAWWEGHCFIRNGYRQVSQGFIFARNYLVGILVIDGASEILSFPTVRVNPTLIYSNELVVQAPGAVYQSFLLQGISLLWNICIPRELHCRCNSIGHILRSWHRRRCVMDKKWFDVASSGGIWFEAAGWQVGQQIGPGRHACWNASTWLLTFYSFCIQHLLV